jgi:3-oxoacyl-[acyl-carrier protein] reductase
MNLSLIGKQALVCGSTQGIGLAIAKELSLLGANCVLLARNEQSLQHATQLLDTARGQVHEYAVADFSDNASVRQAAEAISQKFTIHVLINNTGGPPPGPITEAGDEDFLRAFHQHILNYQLLVQTFLAGMKKARYGRIINIVSTSVKVPIPNLGVSNTIRAATAGWSKTLSQEVARFGITVNNILPGYTRTSRLDSLLATNAARQQVSKDEIEERMQSQIPARRFGEPEEIAALAAFLASPAASYINGTNIAADGGSTGAF